MPGSLEGTTPSEPPADLAIETCPKASSGYPPRDGVLPSVATFLSAVHRILRGRARQYPDRRNNPGNTMRTFTSTLMFIALALAGTMPLAAQQKRLSPHETISKGIDGNRITIIYGRPYSKDPKSAEIRKIWGSLVPFGKVWRTGADEATLLITQKPVELGGTLIPAGAYTLFMLPQADGAAKLIVNRQIGQWGTQYDEKQDLVRLELKKQSADVPADQFTMAIEKGGDGGVLKLIWEDTQYTVAFTVQK
jgi:Protein of unknown function (DUF2911)